MVIVCKMFPKLNLEILNTRWNRLLHGEQSSLTNRIISCNTLTTYHEIDLDFEIYCFFLSRRPGLRKVRPYYFTFTTFTKGRWAKCWNIKITFESGKNLEPHELENENEVRNPNSHFQEMSVVALDSQFVILTNRCPPSPCMYLGEHITHKEGNPILMHFKLILSIKFGFIDQHCNQALIG